MLKECVEVFQKSCSGNMDQAIIDTYIPKDGIYIVVTRDKDTYKIEDPIYIKHNKKKGELEGREHILFEKVREWDYYSQLIDMNKCIDKKKIIHSNNYLTFFIKQESLTNGKLTNEIIQQYYEFLSNPYVKYSKKKKDAQSYQLLEKKIGEVDVTAVNKAKEWIMDHIFHIDENQIQLSGKGYLKIFFDASTQVYQTEGQRYLLPNIYNCTDYNILLNNEVYGLPNDNMGMNSKKPFLENKTKKVKIPTILNNEDVLNQKKLFDYLLNMANSGKVNIYFDLEKNTMSCLNNDEMLTNNFTGIYLRIKADKEVQIINVQTIHSYSPKLKIPFTLQNVSDIDLEKKENSLEYYGIAIKTYEKMRNLINDILFSKFLNSNFFTSPEDIPIKEMTPKHSLLECRDVLFSWFYKGESRNIYSLLRKVTKQLIVYSISNGYLRKACHQFNLRCSLEDYFNVKESSMGDIVFDIRKRISEKVNMKEYCAFESDEEYYFAVGQIVNYFVSLNKTKKRMHSLANPFLNAKKDEIIKDKLRNLFVKYNYIIPTNSVRFNAMYGMIQGYQPNGTVNLDMMIAGYLQRSILFEKKEEKVNE